jgi:hypothetical protein
MREEERDITSIFWVSERVLDTRRENVASYTDF